IVDRTPPPAPTSVLPLPDQVTNKRGQSFKWSATTDADHYLLQVADDASFNNVLNTQTNTGYESLLGQVLVMTEGAFTMPKDGTYYWRVAAIETCADGFNISGFSTTRRFTVDTVKPLIVEVQPAPSSANKISTGMVTFTIRFSELVDPTISLTVKMTTAGGQLMAIEKTSFKEDTWTGTTVVPKNSSALYDGTAIISIEGASDIAGNIMAPDSTHSVVINTGPSFTTKIFSNPANEYQLMIVTRASEALQSPPSCSVQQSSARTPVIMNFLKERFYAGSYKIDITSPGKAYIDLSGTDLYGMVGNDSFQFTVADMNASQRLNITSNSGLASLKGAENSTYAPSAIYMVDREYLESPFTASNFRASALPGTKASVSKPVELTSVLPLEEIGPVSLQLKKRLLYTTDVSREKFAVPADKIHVYRQDKNGNWLFQGGSIKDGKISAELNGLGRVALMADLTEPSVFELSPSSMEKLESAMPEIKGQLADGGSGIKKDSFRLFINDIEIPAVEINETGNFSYKVRQALPKGKHEIRFEVADQAGNTLRKSFQVEAPAPFALDEFMPYPNPATGNAMYFNYNFNQNAEKVQLNIYDTAGHRVADFDTFEFSTKNKGRIRWDLRNNSGKIVANGVYFYKLEVTSGGRTLKKRGKFAVMR
ncbi:MAG: FlgD immunoglobulin-like domain containing protein, partial [Candidatus Riflebacteria bacterium]|nr:FlgD immunoglobulin-like domain containing protein [Candidatus Riflebacteria bacterium]